MANRLPKAAALIAAVIAVPLGAGAATASPVTKPAPQTVQSASQAKALAKLLHQRSDHRATAKKVAPNAAGEPTTGRLAGADRYATSVAVSKTSYDDKQLAGGTLVVASGMQFPDALAGGPAAAGIGGPLLLVPPNGTVPAGTIAEIKRLGVESIVIMGGTGAVSSGIEDQLAKVVPFVDRLYGDNRYETAAFASYFTWQFDEANPDAEPTPPSVVYLSSGKTFADALAGGAAGSIAGAPLMLTDPASLPDVTQFALEDTNPTEVRILGGTGAVSGAVASKIRMVLPNVKITRLGGANRYGTAALTAHNLGLPTGGAVMLANGSTFPDALSASTSSAVIGAPLLLVQQKCLPAETFKAVNELDPRLIRAIGGTAIVSNDALNGKPC
jgi:putative cell wall-binding protein